MKKFMYVAIMALMVVFAGCKSGYNGSDYYIDGRQVVIDYEKGTVNGVKYDDTNECCWMWTLTEKTGGVKVEAFYYVWGTEFEIVAVCETHMYECSRSGRVAEYAYIKATAEKTEDECEAANNK